MQNLLVNLYTILLYQFLILFIRTENPFYIPSKLILQIAFLSS